MIRPMIKPDSKLPTLVLALSAMAVLSAFAGGYFYYRALARTAVEWAHKDAEEQVDKMGAYIESYIACSLKSADALAGIRELRVALTKQDAASMAQANAVLDDFNQAYRADVSYLMDRKGETVASSNRDGPDSFVGKNYAFRRYFQRAMAGVPDVYMALGVTSQKRGIYIGHPVYDTVNGAPLGAAVIKASVDPIDLDFKKPYDGVLVFIDPHGVVFASSREDWRYHFLWEVPAETVAEIAESNQFGDGPWNWTGMQRLDTRHAKDVRGVVYRVHLHEIANAPGWQLIYLHNEALVSEKVAGPLRTTVGFAALALCSAFGLIVLFLHHRARSEIARRKKAEEQRDGLILELRRSLDQVKQLSGLLPICANCKKVRDDKGYWNQIESYIHEHSEAEFSHSICPECAELLYPGLDIYKD